LVSWIDALVPWVGWLVCNGRALVLFIHELAVGVATLALLIGSLIVLVCLLRGFDQWLPLYVSRRVRAAAGTVGRGSSAERVMPCACVVRRQLSFPDRLEAVVNAQPACRCGANRELTLSLEHD
jgi:hypothetical protein